MEKEKAHHWYEDDSNVFTMDQKDIERDTRRRASQLDEKKAHYKVSSSPIPSLITSYIPSSSRPCGCTETGLCMHAKSTLAHDLANINIAAPLDAAKIQRIGLGTHKLIGQSCIDTVSTALKLGYRLIDTARCYKNEEAIAVALQCSNIPRHEIYITSKVDTKEMKSAAKTTEAVMKALDNLKVPYLDLMLLHWPGVKGLPLDSTEHRGKRFEAYKALIEARKEGYVKNIGVSNFLKRHLEELFEDCQKEDIDDYIPYLNQLEIHPMCQQRETVVYCKEMGIMVQAYSSLGSGQLLTNEKLSSIACNYGITVAQLLLSWALHKNIYVIPKSSREEGLKSNYDAFNLSSSLGISLGDMATLDAMDEDQHFCWNPVNIK